MPTTAAEQYLLELINDARMDPVGDAARYIGSYASLASGQSNIQQALSYFGVSGAQLLAAFAALTPVQPVAYNGVLAGGALAHNALMIATGQQSHVLPGEAAFGTRLSSEGYSYRNAGENIYAWTEDPLYTQAAFMVDWGGTADTGGMQAGAGHRVNEMNAAYREVGISITAAPSGSAVGPNVVTEDFGTTGTAGTFLLGVDYADMDSNGFYGIGEGRAGLTISVGGASATSTDSGGWTLATALTGLQTVQLSGGGLAGAAAVRMSLTDSGGNGLNAKLDVVNGTELRVSASASVTGAVSIVRALGVGAVTLASGDGTGRTLVANGGGNTLLGGAGDDVLRGGAGNDVLSAGTGSNTIDGGGGDNTAVLGFSSTQAAITRQGTAWVVDGPGTHDVLTGIQHYQFTDITLDTLVPTMPAVAAAQMVSGTDAASTVSGGAGTVAMGGSGHLTFLGGTGTSFVFGGTGGISYAGGTAYDIVVGGAGTLDAQGGGGGGQFWGASGGDTLRSGTGQSVMVALKGGQVTSTGAAGNFLVAGSGTAVLDGSASAGADVFFGGTGQVAITAGSGNDLIGTGTGTSTVQLGTGKSTVFAFGTSTVTSGSGSADVVMGGTVQLNVAQNAAQGAARSFALFNFVSGTDKIGLQGYAAGAAASAVASQASRAGGTVLTLADQTTIQLIGVARVDAGAFA